MSETCDIEMEGHLIDSLILTKALDKIMDMGGEFEIKTFKIGEKKNDTSYVQITVMGRDAPHLDQILLELHPLLAVRAAAGVRERPDLALLGREALVGAEIVGSRPRGHGQQCPQQGQPDKSTKHPGHRLTTVQVR